MTFELAAEIIASGPISDDEHARRCYAVTRRRQLGLDENGEPSRNKVRRNSHRADRMPPAYYCKITRKEARDLVTAAKLYDIEARKNGKRSLGRVALEILALFANLAAYSGRIDPSYDYIQEKVGCARDSVTRAIRALHAHGFLSWMRRYVPTGKESGPQVKQTTNAYRISLPALAKKLLDAFFKPKQIIPDDIAHAAQERARMVDEMRAGLTIREQMTLDFGAGDPLGEALARLGELIQKRELDKQGQSPVRI